MSEPSEAGLVRLEAIARDALRHYPVAPDSELTLLNISENATYRVDDPVSGEAAVLRVHRPGYHSRSDIESELQWIAALHDAGVVRTASVRPARDGARIVTGADPSGEARNVVMFTWVPGKEPPEDRLVEDFFELGAVTARLHSHARSWTRPAGFSRLTWDYDRSIGSSGHWGRWQDGLGVGPAEHEQLARLDATLRNRLERFGRGPDRFGLIHADMRLANLLIDQSQVAVIDFDDCGFGWYLYDLGSSVSFIEDHPLLPDMIDSWVRGYRTVAPLSVEDVAELPTFVLLRRLLLVAWIGSHSDTELAKEMGEEFTRTSCDLAESYLSRFA
ncbi:MAG TPA: phosphotransferase [Actinomycetes bacterium]|nr:phosphotransferase [Actinomycetes bacterium]